MEKERKEKNGPRSEQKTKKIQGVKYYENEGEKKKKEKQKMKRKKKRGLKMNRMVAPDGDKEIREDGLNSELDSSREWQRQKAS